MLDGRCLPIWKSRCQCFFGNHSHQHHFTIMWIQLSQDHLHFRILEKRQPELTHDKSDREISHQWSNKSHFHVDHPILELPADNYLWRQYHSVTVITRKIQLCWQSPASVSNNRSFIIDMQKYQWTLTQLRLILLVH